MTLTITVLGCGPSAGVPVIGNGWGQCDPKEPRNRRLRCSILIESKQTRILVDTSPDLREQLLDANVSHLDGILYTHGHADHLHGIDELRALNVAMNAPLDLYADLPTSERIKAGFGYALHSIPPSDDGKTYYYRPSLRLHPITAYGSIQINELTIGPIAQSHGPAGPSLGFRVGAFAYSTDVVELDEEAFVALHGLDLWIVGCYRYTPHPTHAHFAKVMAWIRRLAPRRAILTHMTHDLDYRTLADSCPESVEPAFDGMRLLV